VSLRYQAVGWNRQKRLYDLTLVAGVGSYLGTFAAANLMLHPDVTAETIAIRGLGSAAILMLHLVLCIGPLCRLDRRFLPLLYNRRHLGVATFLVGMAHGGLALVQFHALGDVNPVVSVLVGTAPIDSVSRFPFQVLGLAALGILLLMAATSHDFWLANLTAPVWKALHMLVYLAYGLLVAHVALGVLQAETSPILAGALGLGVVTVVALHLAAALRERRADVPLVAGSDGWVVVCAVSEIPDQRARVASVGGDRVAVFRYGGKLSCVSNACQHQNGPLGEGRIVDGFIVCPWHGYQYCPDTGASPEPFTERIPTFNLKVVGGRVLVDPRPNPPGTRVEPAAVEGSG